MHAPCVPCHGEASRGQLVPLKQESTDGFWCQCPPHPGIRALELGNWAPSEEAELLLLAASRRSYEVLGVEVVWRSGSTRSYTLWVQREDTVQKSQSCGGLRTEQGPQCMSTPSPNSPQTHTWKEVREASQILLPECLSSSREFHSNGLLGFRCLLFFTGRKY